MKSLLSLTIVSFMFILGITSCSSIPKKQLPHDANQTEELGKLESEIESGYSNHYEILAGDDFSQALKYRDEAKKDFQKGESKEEVLDSIAKGAAYIERARATADSRKSSADGIIVAREAALRAGVRQSPWVDDFYKADDKMRSDAKKLNELSTQEYSQHQERYLNLELFTIQSRELGPIEKLIKSAEKKDAKRLAPKSYQLANQDFTTAQNSIAADRHNPSKYQHSVKKAYRSAKLLSDVVEVVIQSGSKKTPESVAIQIVQQRDSIKNLKDDLAIAENENTSLSYSMEMQQTEVGKLRNKERAQAVIAEIQSSFDRDEAEVFQQNDKVLIQLKTLNFPSGSSKIPEKSKSLLSKVNAVVSRLSPSDLVIEGHTDSIGGSQKNRELSQARAEAVSAFLENSKGIPGSATVETVGRGDEKPIATNKTKTGRAQNRRVDVIITPDQSTF